LRAQFLAKRFWTLSVWEDQSALTRFVHAQPHAQTMDVMMPHMGETQFLTWSVKGSEIPLSWDDALKRWAEN
jgi:CheY-like chemotaxis protein